MQAAHEYLEKGQLQKAAEEFQSAAKSDEASPDAQISCLLNAGACLVSLGDYEKGLACLSSAGTIISTRPPAGSAVNGEIDKDKASVEVMAADVHYNSALAHQALKNYDQAAQEYQTCLNIHEKSGNLQTSVDLLSALAACHGEAGQFDQEVSCLEKARDVSRQLGDGGREASVSAALARAHLKAGREADCRKMLSTAKMVGSRLDDKKILGTLHSQLGLIHSSLGQHEEALRSFEQALPLVRGAGESDSQQQEASLLQNIGATYNEKHMYSESLAYHREAATMHGRSESHEAEIKTLCNLSFAQSQLKDYTSALATLSEAQERAQTTQNRDLQFQVCESFGGCYYHMSRFSDAEGTFTSALELLDNTEGDAETVRERVMKKLSDVREASQKSTRADPSPSSESQRSPSHNESMEEAAQESRVSSAEGREGKREATARSNTPQSQDSHERELQAYEEALNSSRGSSEALEGTSHHFTDNSSQRSRLEHSLPQGQSGVMSPHLTVTEGSLAIGANARELYTVQQRRTEAGGKGKRQKTSCITEIVRRGEGGREQEPAEGEDDTDDSPQSHGAATVHSKTCLIL